MRRFLEGVIQIGSGDFTHRIDTRSKDEMNKLAQKLNDMTEQVQRSFLEIQLAGSDLSTSSQTLKSLSQKTIQHAQEVKMH